MTMTSDTPYLIRAIYEWISSNQFTPCLLVDATADQVFVPSKYIINGSILFNISSDATKQLVLGNDTITFVARFDSVTRDVVIPIGGVRAIYAAENGQGMVLDGNDSSVHTATSMQRPSNHKPILSVVT